MPTLTSLSQNPVVPFALYTHRKQGSSQFHWYECINNSVDPRDCITLVVKLGLVKEDSTTLHLGYILNGTPVLEVNVYELDDILNRCRLWTTPYRFIAFETGYDCLVDMIHSP